MLLMTSSQKDTLANTIDRDLIRMNQSESYQH
jgi:hypothetical protein